ncbi:MAG: hypothetical protein U0269_06520 [Polyangiales bacterium]
MRRSPVAVLRKIALLAPLAAPLLVAACGRVSSSGATASEPDPRPRPEQSSANCPPAAPATDSACEPSMANARCLYRESSTRCVCEPSGRWMCAAIMPTRGPLPPPELPA